MTDLVPAAVDTVSEALVAAVGNVQPPGKVVITLHLKVRLEANNWLSHAAREVNQVWNFGNATRAQAARPFAGRPRYLSGFDLNYLTAGCGESFERIGSDVAQCVNKELVTRGRQFFRSKLRFRKSSGAKRSLGWIPFKAANLRVKGTRLTFQGKTIRLFQMDRFLEHRHASDAVLGDGNFAQNALGEWFLNVPFTVWIDPTAREAEQQAKAKAAQARKAAKAQSAPEATPAVSTPTKDDGPLQTQVALASPDDLHSAEAACPAIHESVELNTETQTKTKTKTKVKRQSKPKAAGPAPTSVAWRYGPLPVAPHELVGLDPGLKAVVTTSDGEVFEPNRSYRALEPKIAQAQRRGHKKQAQRRGHKKQAKRLHAKAKNQRSNHLHQISRKLIDTYQGLKLGNVSCAFLRSGNHAKSALDGGWGMLKSQLHAKGHRAGRWVMDVNEAYSTQTCSDCGARTGPTGRTGLVVREWTCSACGATHQRDVNSACVIKSSVPAPRCESNPKRPSPTVRREAGRPSAGTR